MRRLILGILLALFLSANAFATESIGIDTDPLDDGLSEEADITNIGRILDFLDEDDDVQEVYHNWDM